MADPSSSLSSSAGVGSTGSTPPLAPSSKPQAQESAAVPSPPPQPDPYRSPPLSAPGVSSPFVTPEPAHKESTEKAAKQANVVSTHALGVAQPTSEDYQRELGSKIGIEQLNEHVERAFTEMADAEAYLLTQYGGSPESVDRSKYQFRNGYCKISCQLVINHLKSVKLLDDGMVIRVNDKEHRLKYAEPADASHGWLELHASDRDDDPIVIEPSYLQFVGEIDSTLSGNYYPNNDNNQRILRENPRVFIGKRSDLIKIIKENLQATKRTPQDQAKISVIWDNPNLLPAIPGSR